MIRCGVSSAGQEIRPRSLVPVRENGVCRASALCRQQDLARSQGRAYCRRGAKTSGGRSAGFSPGETVHGRGGGECRARAGIVAAKQKDSLKAHVHCGRLRIALSKGAAERRRNPAALESIKLSACKEWLTARVDRWLGSKRVGRRLDEIRWISVT